MLVNIELCKLISETYVAAEIQSTSADLLKISRNLKKYIYMYMYMYISKDQLLSLHLLTIVTIYNKSIQFTSLSLCRWIITLSTCSRWIITLSTCSRWIITLSTWLVTNSIIVEDFLNNFKGGIVSTATLTAFIWARGTGFPHTFLTFCLHIYSQ